MSDTAFLVGEEGGDCLYQRSSLNALILSLKSQSWTCSFPHSHPHRAPSVCQAPSHTPGEQRTKCTGFLAQPTTETQRTKANCKKHRKQPFYFKIACTGQSSTFKETSFCFSPSLLFVLFSESTQKLPLDQGPFTITASLPTALRVYPYPRGLPGQPKYAGAMSHRLYGEVICPLLSPRGLTKRNPLLFSCVLRKNSLLKPF